MVLIKVVIMMEMKVVIEVVIHHLHHHHHDQLHQHLLIFGIFHLDWSLLYKASVPPIFDKYCRPYLTNLN